MKIKASVKTKILTACGIAVFLALLALFLLAGDNYELLQTVFHQGTCGEELQEKLHGLGFRGYATISILAMLQVLIAILPAEPVQVVAGIAFGLPAGMICCAIGVFIANTVIFVLYNVYGDKLREYFMKNLDIDFEKAATSDRVALIIFILYLLPAIPYGMICFFAASVGMKYHRFAAITFIGALPSVFIGVGLGDLAIVSGWELSLAIFLVLMALLAVLLIFRKKIFARVNDYIAIHNKNTAASTTVRFYKPSRLTLPFLFVRLWLFLAGVRIRLTDNVGDRIQTPCVVLCNHGSFIDFVYAGSLLRKKSPNFVVARLYFYRKLFNYLLRSIGCFPKSMFTLDYESTKNCIYVLRNGGMLAMMPEARLSTVGRFEDIQPGTFGFLRKMGAPIYTVTIHGDYLADPKWGKGIRRGALVEAELSPLLTGEEITAMTEDEIRARVEERIRYDELAWLSERPKVHYRSARLAEGLENILHVCPVCGAKYTIETKKRTVRCTNCGMTAEMDDRYAFKGAKPFASFAEWYDDQVERLRGEIALGNYRLTSPVTLRLPRADGKRALYTAGTGVCTLTEEGLCYEGTKDGENVTLRFPLKQIYRLLFGAGENFEVYLGNTIHYFVPEEKRSAVEWYMASMILWDNAFSESKILTTERK